MLEHPVGCFFCSFEGKEFRIILSRWRRNSCNVYLWRQGTLICKNIYFMERYFCSIRCSLDLVNVLRKIGFDTVQGVFVSFSTFTGVVSWQKLFVKETVRFQKCLDKGSESMTLQKIFLLFILFLTVFRRIEASFWLFISVFF